MALLPPQAGLQDLQLLQVQSILTGCITAWCGRCTTLNRKALQRVVKTAQHITRMELPSMEDLNTQRCRKKANRIIRDQNHRSHKLFCLLTIPQHPAPRQRAQGRHHPAPRHRAQGRHHQGPVPPGSGAASSGPRHRAQGRHHPAPRHRAQGRLHLAPRHRAQGRLHLALRHRAQGRLHPAPRHRAQGRHHPTRHRHTYTYVLSVCVNCHSTYIYVHTCVHSVYFKYIIYLFLYLNVCIIYVWS
ncbi:uncharacterized protein LOC122867427 isoform X3 [Siniperca chuatsi]|uniref:uncharacterized protein LOC122867427 isoform X3 n=1 Tax=Siniperca chuatsi TaxID=119488 RepID=UPI001CE076AD|nr:uncharacterized protein LOC122867427 isoform X3 [Siniperca chuatsi]